VVIPEINPTTSFARIFLTKTDKNQSNVVASERPDFAHKKH
jgi:hypothetical protein